MPSVLGSGSDNNYNLSDRFKNALDKASSGGKITNAELKSLASSVGNEDDARALSLLNKKDTLTIDLDGKGTDYDAMQINFVDGGGSSGQVSGSQTNTTLNTNGSNFQTTSSSTGTSTGTSSATDNKAKTGDSVSTANSTSTSNQNTSLTLNLNLGVQFSSFLLKYDIQIDPRILDQTLRMLDSASKDPDPTVRAAALVQAVHLVEISNKPELATTLAGLLNNPQNPSNTATPPPTKTPSPPTTGK
ncbi:MAG: hypothetical protein H7263_09980 [Candidatus Sericytochromatia bacterium]|nr:hypothetical protein [Candidatus Sericytochromatia bacterium]